MPARVLVLASVLLGGGLSMLDGTRRIEGVWKGRTKTYDMRGKKFCVIMSGNPYTESGEVFKIPDMLANRADIYNLGDVLGGMEEVFALSYIENSMTSNPVLAPLATRDMADFYCFVDAARGRAFAVTLRGEAKLLTGRLDEELGTQHGIAWSDFVLLEALDAAGGASAPAALAQRMGMTRSRFLLQVLPLEKLGLLARAPAADGQRDLLLRPPGRRLLGEARETAAMVCEAT